MLTSFKKFKTKLELLKIGNCHGFVTLITKRWYSFSGFPFKRFFLDKWIKSILITPDCQCQNRKQGLLNFSSDCLKVVTTISIALCIVTRSHRDVINTDQEMSLTGPQTAIDGNTQRQEPEFFFSLFSKYLVGNVGPKCLSTTPTRRAERLWWYFSVNNKLVCQIQLGSQVEMR